MSARSPRNKPRVAYREHGAHRAPGAAHTIQSFCENNAISPSKYFSLRRQGRGPDEIDLDGRVIITPEAEDEWRVARRRETQAKRAKRARVASSSHEEPAAAQREEGDKATTDV
jgi:hypothetical protein